MTKPLRLNQAQALAEQRGRLLERIAQQRNSLQAQWEPIGRAASTGDRVLAAAQSARQYVQAHRATFTVALAVTSVALVVAKPGRAWRLAKSGFVLWRGWRAVQSAQGVVPGSVWGAVLKLLRRRLFSARFK